MCDCQLQIYIPPKAAQFALSRTKEHNRHLRHEDVDDPEIALKVWDCEWDQFLTYYYQAVHEKAQVAWDSPQQHEVLTPQWVFDQNIITSKLSYLGY